MTAQATPYNVTGTGAVVVTACTYRGFYLNSGAAQTVTIYDNASAASGTVLAQFTASGAGQAFTEAAPDGIHCVNGIYVNVSAGAVAGSVRVG
jgi:hypothetical protein